MALMQSTDFAAPTPNAADFCIRVRETPERGYLSKAFVAAGVRTQEFEAKQGLEPDTSLQRPDARTALHRARAEMQPPVLRQHPVLSGTVERVARVRRLRRSAEHRAACSLARQRGVDRHAGYALRFAMAYWPNGGCGACRQVAAGLVVVSE